MPRCGHANAATAGTAHRGRPVAECGLYSAAKAGIVRSQPYLNNQGGVRRVSRAGCVPASHLTVPLFGWGAGFFAPACVRTTAARTAAVKDGRRPPPTAARSVLERGCAR